MKLEKELLDTTLDDAFTNMFEEVKKSKKNICVAVCITDGKAADKTRMAMHGEADEVLAAICMAIHEYSEKTHKSTTEVLLRIASALSEDK